MPLSEHEQRQLEQIEQALYAEDPRFARNVRVRDPRAHYRHRFVSALVAVVVGAAMIVAGVLTRQPLPGSVLGGAGILVLMVGAAWGLANWRRMHMLHVVGEAERGSGGRRSGRRRPGGRRHGFMQTMEERWNRRTGGN